ncbi:MAG TPA: GxxExxY protein, partial [Prolixibacteraceae bacterium]|nr:GxxExxY protein [Prolixibacteraceae bacterium]
FKGIQVGEYYADLVIDNLIIIELKAAEVIAPEHEHQLINHLRGTEIEVGLLFNFGKKPEFKRKIFDNDKKNILKKNQ